MMNPDGIFRGLWCVDNMTGERVLVNLDTNKIILKSADGKIVFPEENAPTPKVDLQGEAI